MGATVATSCDRAARDIAVALIIRFRNSEISYDALEAEWPRSDDYALEMLRNASWGAFEHRGDELSAQWPFNSEEHKLLTSMALFASTDLPYDWPYSIVASFGNLGWPIITMLCFLSLLVLGTYGWPYAATGVLTVFAIDGVLRYRYSRRVVAMAKAGDSDFWPFTGRADFEAARVNRPDLEA